MIPIPYRELYRINSPVREVSGKVEQYNGSTLTNTFLSSGNLKSFTVERNGENKFFGYGICQKLNVKLRDVDREIELTTADTLKPSISTNTEYYCAFPKFYISECHRDENTNELSITAYDSISRATKFTYVDLGLQVPYTIEDVANACANVLGLDISIMVFDDAFQTVYENGANFDGAETVREILNAIADATQTIYFIDYTETLIFKRLDKDGEPQVVIDKSKYFTLSSKTNRRIGSICHATELGDNITASLDETGTTVYIRDNPFWEMRDDINELVQTALDRVGGLTVNQFDCHWRGNQLIEIGDKIELITKDDKSVYSYVLDDTITFDGGMSQKTQWDYAENEDETASNALTLGDALKQTYARVDKANKAIILVVSDVNEFNDAISSIQMETESISASVKKVEEQTNGALNDLDSEIAVLTKKVEATMSEADVKLEIDKAMSTGANSITTTTGFTFNEYGLHVSKTDSEMETTISEDGMKVFKDGNEVLSADNKGVKAIDLHASTYLIIGVNSRFEDYNNGERTGCFWIGG